MLNASPVGVNTAAAIRITIMAYKYFRLSIPALITPILVRKKLTTGISKIIPQASIMLVVNDIYLVADMTGSRSALPILSRNVNAAGKRIKYANKHPARKARNENNTNTGEYILSLLFMAGDKKAQI